MSLRICSISSGSKGNCIYVSSGNAELVVDLGISYSRADKCIKQIGGSGVENILLTHTHTDHFANVPTALKKGATLYYNASARGEVAGMAGKLVETTGRFDVGDISVMPFFVSHDVPCVGYALRCGASKISIVTDLGHLPGECMDMIKDSSIVLLEANYDEEMLRINNQYPVWLKRRIAGTHGHLSNTAAASAAAELAKNGVGRVILAHISENNNTPEKAYNACAEALDRVKMLGKTLLDIAGQHQLSGIFEAV